MNQVHHSTKEAPYPHEFRQIIVCAACRRRLRVVPVHGVSYYRDTSKSRALDCPLPKDLSAKAANVIDQFDALLRSIEFPKQMNQGDASEALMERQAALEAEQKRLVTAFKKGYMTVEDLTAHVMSICLEVLTLSIRRPTLSADALLDIVRSWSEAAPEKRRDIVSGLLMAEGLIYDLERQAIVGLIPQPSVLQVLGLGLEKTGNWELRAGEIWLREECWPPKCDLPVRHLPPPAQQRLSPAQQEEAVRLLQEPGMSLRKVAAILGASRETIHRLAQKRGIELEQSQKLTLEQREEAFRVLKSGVSLRQTARQFGVSAESLRRLVKRHQPE